jgi:hypothetical protein
LAESEGSFLNSRRPVQKLFELELASNLDGRHTQEQFGTFVSQGKESRQHWVDKSPKLGRYLYLKNFIIVTNNVEIGGKS